MTGELRHTNTMPANWLDSSIDAGTCTEEGSVNSAAAVRIQAHFRRCLVSSPATSPDWRALHHGSLQLRRQHLKTRAKMRASVVKMLCCCGLLCYASRQAVRVEADGQLSHLARLNTPEQLFTTLFMGAGMPLHQIDEMGSGYGNDAFEDVPQISETELVKLKEARFSLPQLKVIGAILLKMADDAEDPQDPEAFSWFSAVELKQAGFSAARLEVLGL